MTTYNLSPDKRNYYSQRNNALDPGITCKPTATVEALAIAGWPVPRGDYPQAEDNLTATCRTGEAHNVMLKVGPDLQGRNPNEVWEVIAWAINDIHLPTKRPVIGPRYNWSLQEALYGITKGYPFAASTWLTKGGHVVVIVGFDTEQSDRPEKIADLDISNVKQIIIDDPYGDRTSGKYEVKSGWNNRYSIAEFWKLWRGVGIQVKPAR